MSNNHRNETPYHQPKRVSISRSKSVSNVKNKKDPIPENLGPLYNEGSTTINSGDIMGSLNAPYHSTYSSESIDRASTGSPTRGLFESHQLNPYAIPGNLHVSSNKSIEHLIKRYGAVTLVRQLSTDLAQREAEISLIRKQNSTRENTLMKLLNEMGLSTSQIELILKEKLEKANAGMSTLDDNSYLKDLINDAMSENFDEVLQSMDSKTSYNSHITPPYRSSTSVNSDTIKASTIPKVTTRPHSLSSPPLPSSNEMKSSTSGSVISQNHSSNSLLNVVSHRFLNHVPQPVHDAIINNSTSNNKKLVPLEMENFDPSDVKPPTYQEQSAEGDRGYIDKFGFMYDRTTKESNSKAGSVKSPLDKSFASRLLEIANDYDRSQNQTNKQWDEFIKKISLLSNDNTSDLLIINGENLSNFKHLYKEFTKLVQAGIPMKYRTKIWSELIGSESLMNPAEYYTLVNDSEANDEAESQIELDLYRTMPFNIFFKDNGPGLKKLKNILIAFSKRCPNIGYCQGMNFIAANMLLVYSNEEDAYWSFVGLIENILPKGFFNLINIKNDLIRFKKNLMENLPRLSEHFANIDVEIEPICFNWFISLFTDSLPIHVVFRIWDIMMLNGYTEIFKISIALFKTFERNLLTFKNNIEVYEFMKNLNKANFNLKSSELIKISSTITISATSKE